MTEAYIDVLVQDYSNSIAIAHWSYCSFAQGHRHIEGLAQERRNSIANAMELRLSCTNP